jgi:phosphate acetyltransferase
MQTDSIRSNERYQRLLHHAQALPPVTMAVAHPCDKVSLAGAVEAARLGLIAPILVGPPERIRGVAERAGLDISGFPLKEAAHTIPPTRRSSSSARRRPRP